MRTGFIVLAALAACATAQAAATSESRADRDACLFVRSIHDFKPLDRNHLIIWSPGRRDAYLVELGMPLPDLKFAHRLAVVDRNRDGRLCSYGMDGIVVADLSPRQPSTVHAMTRLDAQGLAEVEAKYGVRLTRKKADEGADGTDAPRSTQAE